MYFNNLIDLNIFLSRRYQLNRATLIIRRVEIKCMHVCMYVCMMRGHQVSSLKNGGKRGSFIGSSDNKNAFLKVCSLCNRFHCKMINSETLSCLML